MVENDDLTLLKALLKLGLKHIDQLPEDSKHKIHDMGRVLVATEKMYFGEDKKTVHKERF